MSGAGRLFTPRFFLMCGFVILLTRPFAGAFADRVGHRKVLLPCLVLIAAGLALLAVGGTRPWLLASAAIFGTGFGTAYPVFAAHVMKHVDARRRGAAFGGILAAFDTGIGRRRRCGFLAAVLPLCGGAMAGDCAGS